nr:hypothetical protein [Tanacetum cinerariifolium]
NHTAKKIEKGFNDGGVVVPNVQGCTYKTFTNSKPYPFNEIEGVVGLRRWFEKVEQVFEICKCTEEDKVKFAACTFEGLALTWWNENVHTLGLVNANHVTLSKPASLHDAIKMARELVEQAIQAKATRISEGKKRNGKTIRRITTTTSTTITSSKTKGKKLLRLMLQPRLRVEATLENYHCAIGARYIIIKKRKYIKKYPKRINHQNEGARARAYMMRTKDPQQNLNMVTSTFLVNDHYASILFDLGAKKSFVSTAFTPFIDITLSALDTSYEVELADGKVVST